MMDFRIPGETARQLAMRQRAERANRAREASDAQRQATVQMAIMHREWEEELRKFKERMRFDLFLIAESIVMRLEEIRDENAQTLSNPEFNDLFAMAVRLLPEARAFAEDCEMECIRYEEKN